MSFGQFAASSQFFLYGKRSFTRTGWERQRALYDKPDLLTQDLNLAEKIYMITGANSGIGKEMAQFVASKGATVYMLCRSAARAEAARADIVAKAGNDKVHVLEGDVGSEADVRRCWDLFASRSATPEKPRLDALVCNAGALMNEKTLTTEGLEITFASHFLFGTYLLGQLAMPALEATPDSRFVAVSSGGMYNFPFPSWEIATSTSKDPSVKYDGQAAYAYAKRGQVLLCERWAARYPSTKVVSCHPGWTSTPAVDAAYGDTKKYLEPMRSPWEGAEGIIWLMVAPCEKIESGAFYLDRTPRAKHISGPFFTEGSYTKNSAAEVDALMANLHDWANGRRPADLAAQSAAHAESQVAKASPLVAMDRPIEITRFMGLWYIYANIPTFFDKGTVNNTEEYVWDEAQQLIQISFKYSDAELTKTSELVQRASVVNSTRTQWALSPKVGFFLPVSIAYLVVDCAEDYSSCIIGVPDRSYVWIMTRQANPAAAVSDALSKKVQLLGYDVSKLVVNPQTWGPGKKIVSKICK